MTRKVLAIALAWTLVACSGSDNTETTHPGDGEPPDTTPKTPRERLIELEESGAIPKLERGDTLTGTDANANGVRDDIEAFIALNYKTDTQHAAMQMARALQNALTADKTNMQAIEAVSLEISRGINCIYSKFDGAEETTHPAQVAHELEAITTNTKQRLLAYFEFNEALDGTSSTLPEGDTCEQWNEFGFSVLKNTQTQARSETLVCKEAGVGFGYFNGVSNTVKVAGVSLQELKKIHDLKSAKGDEITYELFYNTTEGKLKDALETFEQLSREEGSSLLERLELFHGAMQGGDDWWEEIVVAIPEEKGVLDKFVARLEELVVTHLANFIKNFPTMKNYETHRAQINDWARKGKKMLFVAHSQGNLFANEAYDYALTKTKAESVQVVHIAPVSTRLKSDKYTLADGDRVINGLRRFGNVFNATDEIPVFLKRHPGVGGRIDPLGHNLLAIYINQKLDISRSVKGHINKALDTLEAPYPDAECCVGDNAPCEGPWQECVGYDSDSKTGDPGYCEGEPECRVEEAGCLAWQTCVGYGGNFPGDPGYCEGMPECRLGNLFPLCPAGTTCEGYGGSTLPGAPGHCIPCGASCPPDNSCPEGWTYINQEWCDPCGGTVCPCADDNDCQSGNVCTQAGRCSGPFRCEDDTHCPGSLICQGGKCSPGCNQYLGCYVDEVCVGGRCYSAYANTICDLGTSNGCSALEICLATVDGLGICLPKERCGDDTHCKQGWLCVSNRCTPNLNIELCIATTCH